jgi:hypothetical protein
VSNSIFQALSKQKIDVFRSAYATLSRELFYDNEAHRLRHSAEFGAHRERLCADFLRLYLPTYLNVGSGFLINKDDGVSTQCDLVIFDPQYTPLVEDAERRRFFPVETVAGIGEVKSTLSKQDLLAALIKLAATKRLRDVQSKSPVRRASNLFFEEDGHHFDQLVSFLICEKLSFKFDDLTADISKHYDKEEVPALYRHNLVLSIEDGILCYKNHLLERNIAWMYPWTRNELMKNRLVFPGTSGRNHFGLFTAYMFLMCVNATIYLPELRDYDTPPSMGIYQDEK